jgi:hypothetical protein
MARSHTEVVLVGNALITSKWSKEQCVEEKSFPPWRGKLCKPKLSLAAVTK